MPLSLTKRKKKTHHTLYFDPTAFHKLNIMSFCFTVSIFEGNKDDMSLYANHEHVIRLLEKFRFLAAPAEEKSTDGAIGGEEEVHVITISDFLGVL